MKRQQSDDILMAFYHGNCMAGVLLLKALPLASDVHRYEPVRSVGHLKFSQAVREQGQAICHADAGKQRFHFVVSDIPGYGMLNLHVQSVGQKPSWSFHKLLWNLLHGSFKLLKFAFKFFKIYLNHD